MGNSGLNVLRNNFSELFDKHSLPAAIAAGTVLPPTACAGCVEFETCKGGYLPHRYSKQKGFDNPSVWCADILSIFAHIRSVLGVSANETFARRKALQLLSENHDLLASTE
jgi:uncharacterized protein